MAYDGSGGRRAVTAQATPYYLLGLRSLVTDRIGVPTPAIVFTP
jgi:hypothetical protein